MLVAGLAGAVVCLLGMTRGLGVGLPVLLAVAAAVLTAAVLVARRSDGVARTMAVAGGLAVVLPFAFVAVMLARSEG